MALVAAAAANPKQKQKQQKASIGRRAWRLLRLAVLWARKGSAVHSLRLLSNLRRAGVGLGVVGRGDRLGYGEREYSIEETPAFRFRTPSARVLRLIPCIAPAVPDTPGLYGDEDRYFFARRDTEPECGGGVGYYDYNGEPGECGGVDDESFRDGAMEEQLLELSMLEASAAAVTEDAGVDAKAEEFIAKFHAQMKLQRQISWLQYNEMMERSLR
ncbi:uncharacterized protein [Oryza sativa Japonica Group]|uniref:Long cell-linked locus protein, putative, expressed n=5 Tax=Oryza TaxID=4527 RepID=Q10MM6_ORYSJ|nr:uncharacterized protein LOC4332584 [Oryza sativa Japonica Group]XP_052146987.1 uncharacterized protein LOC127766025 [Oryza glaberrima]ABF95501.1 long cell-linked locus protein, putative, expressed [Oryza sativa Japonica Group]EAZ26631.1 hypothetical protein OsJ_10535 [Oryza sativa Japonica Group]KAF2938853.1 hypothetical protein DAI22_03g148700 [Oryza sativa Japonica Group]BAF11786.1 Os03g0302800 [Oryza sativa Japonica Group]BAG87840.1 unnamed protein product [Oryza sativa Japonica Group]|eukprot:NP_001049872.1 Os03g0302800 [Oryza sativa Japonica Group]